MCKKCNGGNIMRLAYKYVVTYKFKVKSESKMKVMIQGAKTKV